MEHELDGMMGFDKLGLYYEVHMVGIDGECFLYNVYFEEGPAEGKFEQVNSAINDFRSASGDNSIYIDVSDAGEKVSIFLDLGGADPDEGNDAINGVLRALNDVPDIRLVLINED